MTSFIATRGAGLERLAAFKPRMGQAYAKGRNYDLGAGHHSHVSTLSPYVRHRLVSEKELIATALDGQGAKAAEKFIDEVFWRTYWKGWLEQRPSVWHQYENLVAAEEARLKAKGGLQKTYNAAVSGTTGIAPFDDWVDELKETGYLHNHARMWFASIWIFTLKLPWALGADFFLYHLLDGDPASNTLSWRWVGGMQTQGKTYLARASNIETYTKGRHNPQGQLAVRADPLPFEPATITALPISDPASDVSEASLIVTDDCLDPLAHLPPDFKPTKAILLDTRELRTPRGCAKRVSDFVLGGLKDTKNRLEEIGIATRILSPQAAPQAAMTDKVEGPILYLHAPVGPNQQALSQVIEALEESGTPCSRAIAPFDEAGWPPAKKGFFAYKKAIPSLIDTFFDVELRGQAFSAKGSQSSFDFSQ